MAQKIVIDSGKLLNSSYDKIKLTLFKRINRMKLSASNKMLDRELNSFEKILENKCRPSINFKKLEIFAPKL